MQTVSYPFSWCKLSFDLLEYLVNWLTSMLVTKLWLPAFSNRGIGIINLGKLLIMNVKKIALENKEHITDKKMGVSAPLRLFISSNEVCNTAYILQRTHEQNYIFKDSTMAQWSPRKWNIICTMVKYGETFYRRQTALIPAAV